MIRFSAEGKIKTREYKDKIYADLMYLGGKASLSFGGDLDPVRFDGLMVKVQGEVRSGKTGLYLFVEAVE